MNIQRNILSLLISISLTACGVSNFPVPTLSSQGIDSCTLDVLSDTGFDAKGTLKIPLLSKVQSIKRTGKKLFAIGQLSSDPQCIAVVGLDTVTGKPLKGFGNKGLATLRVADSTGAQAIPKDLDLFGETVFVVGSVDSPTEAQKGFLVSFDSRGNVLPLTARDDRFFLDGSFGTYESTDLTTYATSINSLEFLSTDGNSLALVGRVRRDTLFGKPNDDIFMAVLDLSKVEPAFAKAPGRETYRRYVEGLDIIPLGRRGPIQHNVITDESSATGNLSDDTALAATSDSSGNLLFTGVSKLDGKHMASTSYLDLHATQKIENYSKEKEYCNKPSWGLHLKSCETTIYGRWNSSFAADSLKVLPSWTVSNAQVYMDSPWAESTGVLDEGYILVSGSHKITNGYPWHKAFYLMAYTHPVGIIPSQLEASFGEKKGITSTTFSVDGTVVDAFGQALLEQRDKDTFLGYIIVGYISDGFNSEMALARYTTDGMTDKTFGSAGHLTTSLGQTKAYSGVVGQNGEIFAAGEFKEVTGMTVGIVQRFDKDGLMSP
ncbi:MAG: hypothetical protein U0Z75_02865 [Deinococcaceae bacterium]